MTTILYTFHVLYIYLNILIKCINKSICFLNKLDFGRTKFGHVDLLNAKLDSNLSAQNKYYIRHYI